jgi:prephenate dehydrogenase
VQTIQIGIIGGTGGMGQLFARFFRDAGYTVYESGRKTGPDIPQIAETCQVVIVSCPIEVTVEVIEQAGPLMRKDALLMDLTSLKAEPVHAMLQSSAAAVIGLHPLFGPAVDTLAGHRIVICPARAGHWLAWVREIFTRQGSLLIEMTPERHDELMAMVQALNHLNSIAMGMVLKAWGIELAALETVATPMFAQKLAIIKELFTQNPGLYAEIITRNPASERIIEIYQRVLGDLATFIVEKDAKTLTQLMEQRSLW